jgi:hypothetical protein
MIREFSEIEPSVNVAFQAPVAWVGAFRAGEKADKKSHCHENEVHRGNLREKSVRPISCSTISRALEFRAAIRDAKQIKRSM